MTGVVSLEIYVRVWFLLRSFGLGRRIPVLGAYAETWF